MDIVEIPGECAYNLMRMWTVVRKMIELRKYKIETISPLGSSSDKVYPIKEGSKKIEAASMQRSLHWESWCEVFSFEGDPYEQLSTDQFEKLRRDMSFECLDASGKSVAVFWYTSSKLGIGNVKTLLSSFKEYETLILIVNTKITSSAQNHIRTAEGVHLDIFSDKDLYVDITEHSLVHRHEICSEKEKEKILRTFGKPTSPNRYDGVPLILDSDPPVKFIGAKEGDLIKIYRPSFTQHLSAGADKKALSLSYRLVTKKK